MLHNHLQNQGHASVPVQHQGQGGDPAGHREAALHDHQYIDPEATITASQGEVDTGTMTATESAQEQGVLHDDEVLQSGEDFALPMSFDRYQQLKSQGLLCSTVELIKINIIKCNILQNLKFSATGCFAVTVFT